VIFASDLDRTLIYSKSFINEDMKDIVPVEKRDEEIISYMSNTSMKLLRLLSKRITFIPVTSRSLQQFNRLTFFKNDLINKYAVVANGGILLKDNKIDVQWQKLIKSQLDEIILPEELLAKLSKFLKNPEVNSFSCCDNIFVYIVLKSNVIEEECVKELQLICSSYGYETVKNGRKIYIIPYFINKWAPLKYIMEIEQETELITAGDSILDFPMLENSMKAFVPGHGELNMKYVGLLSENKKVFCTKNHGIYSSDELLNKVCLLI
jgi:hydroxymethylpyrimidine pyrophosphatase-like HAD family hydrolase